MNRRSNSSLINQAKAWDALLVQCHVDAIKKAMKAGHEDPRLPENYDQVGCMLDFLMEKGRRFLQFFSEFGTIDPAKLQKGQVRKNQIDDDIVQKIRASLLAGEDLWHPIVTKRISAHAERIIHGHHRWAAWKLAFPGIPIPRYVISDTMAEAFVGEDGTISFELADKIPYRQLFSAVAPNPPNKNKEYHMIDVANQVALALEADATLGGIKDRDVALTRQVLGDWMDIWLSGYFPDETTRGKILAEYEKGDPTTQVLPMRDKEAQAFNLVAHNWDPKPQDWLDWYDTTSKTLQSIVPWREDNAPMLVLFQKLVRAYHLGTHDKLNSYIDAGCNEIGLYIEIYTKRKQFAPNLPSLNADRASAIKSVKEMNELLYKCGVPFQITKVLFPDQLTDKKDVAKVRKVAKYAPPRAKSQPKTEQQPTVH